MVIDWSTNKNSTGALKTLAAIYLSVKLASSSSTLTQQRMVLLTLTNSYSVLEVHPMQFARKLLKKLLQSLTSMVMAKFPLMSLNKYSVVPIIPEFWLVRWQPMMCLFSSYPHLVIKTKTADSHGPNGVITTQQYQLRSKVMMFSVTWWQLLGNFEERKSETTKI